MSNIGIKIELEWPDDGLIDHLKTFYIDDMSKIDGVWHRLLDSVSSPGTVSLIFDDDTSETFNTTELNEVEFCLYVVH